MPSLVEVDREAVVEAASRECKVLYRGEMIRTSLVSSWRWYRGGCKGSRSWVLMEVKRVQRI